MQTELQREGQDADHQATGVSGDTAKATCSVPRAPSPPRLPLPQAGEELSGVLRAARWWHYAFYTEEIGDAKPIVNGATFKRSQRCRPGRCLRVLRLKPWGH